MSDIVLVIILSVTTWFHQVATAYELETNSQLVSLQDVNSFLWAEGENTTARLKQCEKRKKR